MNEESTLGPDGYAVYKCDECDKRATTFARMMNERAPRDGEAQDCRYYEPGKTRWGCQDHPVCGKPIWIALSIKDEVPTVEGIFHDKKSAELFDENLEDIYVTLSGPHFVEE